MNSDNENISSDARTPKNAAYLKHILIIDLGDMFLFSPKALEIRRVTARFIPEVASVIPKPYTPLISEYTPIASAPTLFEMYTLKYIPTVRIASDTPIRINALYKNVCSFFIYCSLYCFI